MDWLLIQQDRFTICFKNLWNKPLWVLALQKKKSDSFKNQTGLKTSPAFGAVKPVTKYVTRAVTMPLGTEKILLMNKSLTYLLTSISNNPGSFQELPLSWILFFKKSPIIELK